jgi:hypothetical protein
MVTVSCASRRTLDCAGGLIMADAVPAPQILYPEWQYEYQAALLELDRKRLLERVTAAETAIFKRLQAISHDADHNAERQAIEDALASLRVLKRDSLGFPDWEKK